MKTKQIRGYAALALTCVSLAGARAAITYSLTDLGPGGANDINARGRVVGNDAAGGWYYDGTNRTALNFQLQYPDAPPQSPTYSLTAATAVAINDSDRIVGSTYFPSPPDTRLNGYIYDAGEAGSVGVLLGATHHPLGVGASGETVGTYFTYDGTLAPLYGAFGTAHAVNASGLVVGSANPISQAVTFDSRTNSPLDLSAVNTSGIAVPGSVALSVNDAGQIVGYLSDYNGRPEPVPSVAFLYANGSAVSLGTLGGVRAVAKDINNAGGIVGTCSLANEQFHAFVHTGGAMLDLNTLISSGGTGWVLTSANAVNDAGVIVGEGLKDGVPHAFLLTPTTSNLPPAIILPPVGATVYAGEPFSLSVVAAGSGPLTYQWQHAGTNLLWATNATYAVERSGNRDPGGYVVKVSNPIGTTVTDIVSVQVKEFPELQAALYAGITLTGAVGSTFRIQSVEHAGDTNWQVRGTVTLTTSPFFWVDPDSARHTGRLYRAVH